MKIIKSMVRKFYILFYKVFKNNFWWY